jgi:hypothetical protein
MGGQYPDPFCRSMHGGYWGVNRVALNKMRVLPGSRKGCGDITSRSGFFLHGGIMSRSSLRIYRYRKF